jgi:Cell division protein
MRRYSVTYFIGQSIKGLWRNGVMSLASITVLMSCLTVMGSFSLLVLNINHNLNLLGVLNEIVVFIDIEKDDLEIANIETQIKALENVGEVEYISKSEALENERVKYEKYPGVFTLIDERGDQDKVLPATFIITYTDNSKVSTLQYKLEHNIEGIKKVHCNADLAQTLENAKNGIIVIFIWFLIILFVVSIFVIINTIKLAVYSRRQEINIMRYVGATNWFIVLPFIFEGVLIGFVASGIGYLIVWYAYRYVCNIVMVDFQMIQMIMFNDIGFILGASFLLIGVLTGIIGSCISLNKYLKA